MQCSTLVQTNLALSPSLCRLPSLYTRLLPHSRRRDKHSGFPRFKRSHGWRQIVCMCFSIFLRSLPLSCLSVSLKQLADQLKSREPTIRRLLFRISRILRFPSHMLQDPDHDLRRYTKAQSRLCCCCYVCCCYL